MAATRDLANELQAPVTAWPSDDDVVQRDIRDEERDVVDQVSTTAELGRPERLTGDGWPVVVLIECEMNVRPGHFEGFVHTPMLASR
jgi:hypothetical protein